MESGGILGGKEGGGRGGGSCFAPILIEAFWDSAKQLMKPKQQQYATRTINNTVYIMVYNRVGHIYIT